MLAELLARYPEAARTPDQRRAVAAILSCRTPARGGNLYVCPCGEVHFAGHSCHHRACANCGGLKEEDWLQERKLRLLPMPYFLLTFTVPEELREIFRLRPELLYHLLFQVSAQALQDVALSKLGGQPGFLGVLHTWTRQLIFHPHVHYIVPGGFLSPDQRRWIRLTDPQYLLPEKVLSRRARSLFRSELARQAPELLAKVKSAAWRKEWVVNTQPVGSGEKALSYLARYVQRTALSAQRIVKEEHGQVTFKYRSRDAGGWKLLTLETPEFLRRFLQHVLPRGFHRVRYFGWLSPAAKGRWARILALLDWQEPPRPPRRAPWVMQCPCCGETMRLAGSLPRLPNRPP
jgi:hypothetical protein